MAGIRTRKRGKSWYFAVEAKTLSSKRKVIERGVFKTERDAINAGIKEYGSYKMGNIALVSEKVNLGDFLQSWLEVKKREVRPGTHHTYVVCVNKLTPLLGNIEVQKLRPHDVDFLIICDNEKFMLYCNKKRKRSEFMAKLTRKLKQKIAPPKKEQPKKLGKDYFLLIVLFLTFVVMLAGWPHLDNLNRILYLLLTLSLSLTYANRHFEMSERVHRIIERLGIGTIAFSILIFVVICYNQFIR